MRLKILLLSVFLLILPVSNELIQKNIGFEQSPAIGYNINKQDAPVRAPGLSSTTVYGDDGKPFTIIYWERIIIDGGKIHIYSDGGLGLDEYYDNEDSFLRAIQAALAVYNHTAPLGDAWCLLVFALIFVIYDLFHKKRIREIRNSRAITY